MGVKVICAAPGHAAQIIQGLYQRTFETRVASCSGVTAESDGGMLADRRCMNIHVKLKKYYSISLFVKWKNAFIFLRSFLSLISGRRVFLEHIWPPSVLTVSVLSMSWHHAADSTSSVVPILIGGLKNTSNAEMPKTILQIAIWGKKCTHAYSKGDYRSVFYTQCVNHVLHI